MAKIVRKKVRRRINWSGLVSLIFVFSIGYFLVTSIFARSENARLVREIERTKLEIVQKNVENKELVRQINALSDYTHILSIAEEAGLSYNAENSYFVRIGD